DVALERLGRIVVLAPDHPLHVQDGNISAAAMLYEFVVVDCAVVVHDICRLLILAQNDVRWVTEQLAIEPVQRNPGATHDSVRRVIVCCRARLFQINRIDTWSAPARGEEERVACERGMCETGEETAARNQLQEFHGPSPLSDPAPVPAPIEACRASI